VSWPLFVQTALLTVTPAGALVALQQTEAAMEDRRLAGDPGYNCLRHVDLLIALMAEMRIVL
jgi:hypothetical protein